MPFSIQETIAQIVYTELLWFMLPENLFHILILSVKTRSDEQNSNLIRAKFCPHLHPYKTTDLNGRCA